MAAMPRRCWIARPERRRAHPVCRSTENFAAHDSTTGASREPYQAVVKIMEAVAVAIPPQVLIPEIPALSRGLHACAALIASLSSEAIREEMKVTPARRPGMSVPPDLRA